MNLDELLLNINNVSFDSAICQSDIKSVADIDAYNKNGYSIRLTNAEFKDSFPDIDPKHIIYIPSISTSCLYFNPETLAVAPFHMEFLLASFDGFNAAGAQRAIAKREAEVATGDYLGSVTTLPDRMRLEYFARLIAQKGANINNLYELFFDVYTSSDYGFNGLDKEAMQTILNSKTPADQAKTAEALKDLPATVTIYRGGNTASADYRDAYSWTLDMSVANFFACRRGTGLGYIVQAEVAKEDIIDAFLNSRDEQEIIVDPTNLQIVKEIPIHGMQLLSEMLPKVAPIYKEFVEEMDWLDFAQESEYHGKSHEARVLLLTQIISEMLDLPLHQRQLLAAAAIYHDTQRVHDYDDECHGEDAADYYAQTEEDPNPIVEFLCKYHCLPDQEGYAEIQRNESLRPQAETVTRLYQVFKDADALDRIRFGDIKELDLHQLRLDESKGLTLVARLCIENLRPEQKQRQVDAVIEDAAPRSAKTEQTQAPTATKNDHTLS